MSYINNALKDELEINIRMQDAFNRKLSSIPHGAVAIKKNKYVYLVYKHKGKCISKYMGINSNDLLNQINHNNQLYKEVKQNIKNLKKEETRIKKAMKQFNN